MKRKFEIIDNGIFDKSLQKSGHLDVLTPMEALQVVGGESSCGIQLCGAKACGCDSCFGHVSCVGKASAV